MAKAKIADVYIQVRDVIGETIKDSKDCHYASKKIVMIMTELAGMDKEHKDAARNLYI